MNKAGTFLLETIEVEIVRSPYKDTYRRPVRGRDRGQTRSESSYDVISMISLA